MVASKLKRFLRAGRKHDFAWRYLYNLGPTLAYRLRRHPLTEEGRRIVADLGRDGVAVTSVDRLFADPGLFEELRATVAQRERDRAEEIAAARREAGDAGSIGHKTFLHKLLGEDPVFDPSDVFARFALQSELLSIANAYFGMFTQLRYYNVWRTFVTDSAFRESQLWHRDREDLYVLKLFLNLSDVDEGAGPFTYAAGTHPKGRVRGEPASFVEGGVERSGDDEMAAVLPRERWVRGLGPPGTLLLADTRGYHRGGRSRDRDRLLYTCLYTSQASEVRELFGGRLAAEPPADRARAFALRRGRR